MFFKRFFVFWVGLALLTLIYSTGTGWSNSLKNNLSNPNTLGPGEYPNFSPRGDIRRFLGETLLFNISFLIFNNAATAKVTLFEKNGLLHSELVAETKGVVGFFTAYRKHVYKSTFDLTENNQRLRTRKFEREVIIGDDVERTVHYLDYNSRAQHWFLYKNSKLTKSKIEPIPEGVYFDDILAAFYNFRNGVYGDLGKGKNYKIDTIPDKSMKDISVYIKTDEEREKFNEDQQRADVDDLLVLKVAVPKDVFKTKTGELLFWSSKHFIPLETTIKNYVAFGDLHAKFDKRIQTNSRHAAATHN